jgi:hypothetical protein
MSVCAFCGDPLMPKKMYCQRCGLWTPSETAAIGSVSKSKTTTLDQVVSTQVQRVSAGEPWDECFGGGIVVTSSSLIGGAPGGGKAVSIATYIPTPSGWTTMGEVKYGDTIFDDRGEICRVIGAYKIMYDRPCYAVKFTDGEKIVCDADHLWLTMTNTERNGRYAQSGCGSVRTTLQIANSVRFSKNSTHPNGVANHTVARAAPLVLPEVNLPIEPYTLGVWLGDGYKVGAEFTGKDDGVARRVNADGYSTTKRSLPNKDYPNRSPVWTVHGIRAQLIEMGLWRNKHIPEIYLRASVAQRLELLRGLMDTDGDCSVRGMCGFNTKSRVIRCGVAELLATLGIKSNYIELEAWLNGRYYGKYWRFCFKTTTRVFNLRRKYVRQGAVVGGRTTRRSIASVRRVKSVPVRCIMVDSPSKLYLVGRSMVPTHNTTGLLQVSAKIADVTGKRAYLISAEQAPGDIKLTVERLKLDASKFRVLSEYGGGGGADVDEDLIKDDPPASFVIDSVSAMCGKDVHAAIMIARRYKVLANKYNAPAFLICHMTKEHDFAGLLALQHEVDTLITIFPEDDGRRHLRSWKNRFGPTHAEYFMMMTELGLVPIPKKDKGKKSSVSVPSELDARRGPGDEEDFEDEEEDADEEEDEGDGGGDDDVEAAKPKARVPRFQAAVEASAALSPSASVKIKARPVVLPRPPPLPAPVVEPPTAAERAARIRAKLAAKKAKKKMTSVSVEVTYLAWAARR